MHLPDTISSDLNAYFNAHFDDFPQDYVCVYGSSIYSPDKRTSDVDLFAVTHRKAGQQSLLAASPSLAEFITGFHIEHGRRLDTEVPYDNKIQYTAEEIENAIQFGGFQVEGSKIIVPSVKKETSFLRSPAIKARLALNALTSPHLVIGEDLTRYQVARRRASEAATLLGVSLLDREEFDVPMVQAALTTSESGAVGEMFLGYKTEHPIVGEYLRSVVDDSLSRLSKESGMVTPSSHGYTINRESFDPPKYMKTTAPLRKHG
jgi:hypothetical protein